MTTPAISTIYRILNENKQVKDLRRQARHSARAIPELVATGPGQVFSWDVTKLAGPVKGKYFDAYVMIDIYSRYIVGCQVRAAESGADARARNLERFATSQDPEILAIPTTAWINNLAEKTEQKLAAFTPACLFALTDSGVLRCSTLHYLEERAQILPPQREVSLRLRETPKTIRAPRRVNAKPTVTTGATSKPVSARVAATMS